MGNDARKAYQNFDRDCLWVVVETEFPEIANLVRLCYGIPSAVLLQDAGLGDPVVLLNGVGARQGCPLGSLIYCIAQHPILVEVAEAHQDLGIHAFVDDVSFISTLQVGTDDGTEAATMTPETPRAASPVTTCSACVANEMYSYPVHAPAAGGAE